MIFYKYFLYLFFYPVFRAYGNYFTIYFHFNSVGQGELEEGYLFRDDLLVAFHIFYLDGIFCLVNNPSLYPFISFSCELSATSTGRPMNSCRNIFCGVIITEYYKKQGNYRLFLRFDLSSLSLISMVSEESSYSLELPLLSVYGPLEVLSGLFLQFLRRHIYF